MTPEEVADQAWLDRRVAVISKGLMICAVGVIAWIAAELFMALP